MHNGAKAGLLAANKRRTAAWTPDSLPSLEALYYANNSGSLHVTSDTLTQWDDQSGHSRNLTVLAGMTGPSSGLRTMNSLNAIGFDGSSMSLGVSGLTAIAGNAHSFYAIIDQDAQIVDFARIWSLADTGAHDFDNTTSISGILRDNTNDAWGGYYNGSPTNAKTASNSAKHLLVAIRNGDTYNIYVDNVAATQTTGLGTAALHITRFFIGVNCHASLSSGNSYFKGGIGSLGWSSAAWDGTARGNLLTYSQSVWGTP